MKKNKLLVIAFILLFLCIVLILIYFIYTKVLNKNDEEDLIIKEEIPINKVYQGSAVLTDNKYNYLVVKKDNEWYEVDKNDNKNKIGFKILGVYNDKVYYSDLIGIKYVDLVDNFKVVLFSSKDKANSENTFFSYFSNDKLYVEVENVIDNESDDLEDVFYSIIEYDLKEIYKDRNGKKLITLKNNLVKFFVIEDHLVYLDNYKDDEYKISQYIIPNDEISTVADDVCDFDIYKNYIIYTQRDSKNDEDYLYYLLHIATDKSIFIGSKEMHAVINNKLYFQDGKKIYMFDDENDKVRYILNGKFSYTGDYLYYLSNNKIYKYNNGIKTIMYTALNAEKIKGFSVDSMTGEDIIYIYTEEGSFVIENSKKKSLDDFPIKYEVNMKDGTVKSFDYYASNDKESSFDSIAYEEYLDED